MHRLLRISLWVLAVFFVVTAGAFMYLRNADLSVYEDQIERYLSEAIGHKFDVDGLFELRFGNLTHVTAEEITLSNTDWDSDPVILSVGHFSVTVNLWSLISGPIIIEDLDIREVRVRLEKNDEAQANWATGRVRDESKPKVEFDRELIAFKKVQVQDVKFVYMDPARPRPLNVELEQLTVSPDENHVLDLDLNGSINEIPVWADGKLGPWENLLDGHNIIADLDMTLGQVRITVDGSVDNLPKLFGTELSLSISGPAIERITDRLGLPPFAEGAFNIDGRILKLDVGSQLRLDGKIGAIEIFASGNTDSLIDPGKAQLDFNISGPDTQYVAEVFGIDGAPAVPFQVSGKVNKDDDRFEFTRTRVQLGENSLGVDGWLDFGGVVPNGDLSVSATGPDFSIIGPFARLQGVPAEAFDIHGRIQKTGASWRFDDVEAVVGDIRIAADGAIGEKGSADTEISFSATGPDISFVQAMTGLQGIPAKPFNVSASVKPDRIGIRLENAKGIFGDNRLELDGVIATGKGMIGTNLIIRGSGPELKNVSLLTGVPYLPNGPFEFGATVQLEKNKLRLSEASAAAGGMDGSATGTVGLADDAGNFDLVLSANGPDLATALPFEQLEHMSGESFSFEGRVNHQTDKYELHSVSANIGNIEVNVDGELANDGETGDFRIDVSSPDSVVLSKLTRLEDLPDGTVSMSGRIERTSTELEFTDVEARIGDYAFILDGTLSNAPLSNSSDLHFSAFGPDLEQLGLPFNIDGLPAKQFRVAGEVNGIPTGFAVEKLIAKIGENNIDGRFTVDLRDKPEVTGYLSSTFIDLREDDQPEEAEADEVEESEFLFSDEPLDMEWLQAANLDLSIKTDRLMLPQGDVQDYQINLKLWDGELDIDPISFRETDGRVSSSVHLGPSNGSYVFAVSMNAENMHIGLLASDDQPRDTLPPVGGHIEFKGTGNSLHELMASLNGSVVLRQDSGRVRGLGGSRLFGDLALEIVRTLNPLATTQEHATLDCAIYDIEIKDGIATIEKFALQTDKMAVVIRGNVNLGSEQMNLSLQATPREGLGISIGSVANSFLKLGGTLRSPKLQIDKTGSITTTGAAIATGGLSLVAKGMWDRVKASADICEEILSQQ